MDVQMSIVKPKHKKLFQKYNLYKFIKDKKSHYVIYIGLDESYKSAPLPRQLPSTMQPPADWIPKHTFKFIEPQNIPSPYTNTLLSIRLSEVHMIKKLNKKDEALILLRNHKFGANIIW